MVPVGPYGRNTSIHVFTLYDTVSVRGRKRLAGGLRRHFIHFENIAGALVDGHLHRVVVVRHVVAVVLALELRLLLLLLLLHPVLLLAFAASLLVYLFHCTQLFL